MDNDRSRESAVSMDKEQIRKLGYEIVDIIADELGDPSKRPIYPRIDWRIFSYSSAGILSVLED